MCGSTQSLDGFSETQAEHHQHQLETRLNPSRGSKSTTRERASIISISRQSLQTFSTVSEPLTTQWGLRFDPITDSAKRKPSIISISRQSLQTFSTVSEPLTTQWGLQFDPIIGRIQRNASRASSASAGSPFEPPAGAASRQQRNWRASSAAAGNPFKLSPLFPSL